MTDVQRLYKSTSDLEDDEIRKIYKYFDSPVARLDCGRKCALHNPSGKPFCCDICHAVPAAYKSERRYLEPSTKLWHGWRGNECGAHTPKSQYAEGYDTACLFRILAM